MLGGPSRRRAMAPLQPLLHALALAAASVPMAEAAQLGAAARMAANPIRKVVNMLHSIQTRVSEEGKAEEALYNKFMCYCKTGGTDLAASIATAEAKIPAVGSEVEASVSKLTQAKADLAQAQTDRTAAEAAVAEATALREKEAAAYASMKAEYVSNIAAIAKAVSALEAGTAGSFLQTGAAQALRRLATGDTDMLDADRQLLLAFLSQGAGYSPQSDEIIGILKQLSDTMAASLADATATEQGAISTYEAMMAAKRDELAALASTVETKTQQIGETGVSIVHMQEDLADTQAALDEDKKYLAQLDTNCATKTSEWEERSKVRADELIALADAIKVLNDDDAMELFKKTLPSASASFVQVLDSASALRARALSAVHAARQAGGHQDRAGLDVLALMLTGKKALTQGGFDKVIQMIDSMIAVLKREQEADDQKRAYCSAELGKADDKRKSAELKHSDEENAIATLEGGIATVTSEIAALVTGIKDLDQSVAEATAQRKAENSEFKDSLASNAAAKELLLFVKNKLNKFYNPKLHTAAAKVQLSPADSIADAFGGDVATSPAPGGIAGTGITALVQVSAHASLRDAQPPETWNAYTKQSEATTGVIAMMDLLIADLDKEITVSKTEEDNAQAAYQALMADSTEKRATDSKALTQKGSTKADLEAQLEVHKEARKEAGADLATTLQLIESLHAECDWLLQNSDVRKEARANEADALRKAQAVLAGADYALVQTHRFLRRSSPRAGTVV